MEFGLLGLFEVRAGDRPIDLPRGKERALLVVLLLHANAPVSTDRLADDLWGDRLPENAAKAVQVYVSRLRKSLGSERLRTTAAGYVLHVEQDELDVDRFARLVAAGRTALTAGDAAAAERLLAQALALWRGPPLAEFRFERFAQEEMRRLEEFRDEAEADLIDARLQQGRAADVVPALESLVERQPLWERPRAQLMLALYRTGRQAAALELYRSTRAMLATELGIDPSAELQGLERAILNQDDKLRLPAAFANRVTSGRGAAVVLTGGLAIVVAAAVVALLVVRGGRGPISLTPGSIAVIDAGSIRLVAQLAPGGIPTRLAAGGGLVWVGADASDTATAVSVKNHRVEHVAAAIGFPSDVAVGEGAVWAADGASGILTKIDPNYGTVAGRIRVAPRNLISYDRSRELFDPTSVAAGLGSVWTTNGSTSLTRVDPVTVRLENRVDLGAPLDAVTIGGGAVWAVSGPEAALFRVGRDGRESLRIPIASKPGKSSAYPIGVVYGDGFVWVLNANAATVTKIDPRTRSVVATIGIGVERIPDRIAAGTGHVWVADRDGTLVRIDSASDAQRVVTVGESLRDIAVVGNRIWVTAGLGPGGFAAPASAASGVGSARPVQASCSPVYYESGTRPRFLIAADLALQGNGGSLDAQMGEAIQFVLLQHRFRAGPYVIGYQSCDRSTPGGGLGLARCRENARAYAADASLIGLIAPAASGCSKVEIPLTDAAATGPVPMVGLNTLVGLTHSGPGAQPGEPGKYYPTGTRNYVRVVASDDVQGAASALQARDVGAKRVFAISDGDVSYGAGVEAGFARAARRLRLEVGTATWTWGGNNSALTVRLRRFGPDAVFIGTFQTPQSLQLIKDIRGAVPEAKLFVPDGFNPSDLVSAAGALAEGITVTSVSGKPLRDLPPAGRRFVAGFAKATGNTPQDPSISAAQATEVLLDAIAHSDGTRTSIVRRLFRTRVKNGILGSFGFDQDGDTTLASVTVYRITHGSPIALRALTPPRALVR